MLTYSVGPRRVPRLLSCSVRAGPGDNSLKAFLAPVLGRNPAPESVFCLEFTIFPAADERRRSRARRQRLTRPGTNGYCDSFECAFSFSDDSLGLRGRNINVGRLGMEIARFSLYFGVGIRCIIR